MLDNLLSLSPPVLQSLNIASITHLAETLQKFSHDTINRYLRNEQLTPSLFWQHIKLDLKEFEDEKKCF